MSTTRSVTVKAKVSTVWEMFEEMKWEEWNPTIESIRDYEGEFTNGATCTFLLAKGTGGIQLEGTLYQIESQKKFSFEGKGMAGMMIFEGTMELEPSTEDPNHTKVTYTLGMEGFMGPVMNMCYKGNIIISCEETVEKLAEVAEIVQLRKK